MTAAILFIMKSIKEILLLIISLMPVSLFAKVSQTTLEKAQNGDAESQFFVAQSLANGFFCGNYKDEEVGYWLKKAANNGHPDAQYWLALSYNFGHYGISADQDEYMYWLKIISQKHSMI